MAKKECSGTSKTAVTNYRRNKVSVTTTLVIYQVTKERSDRLIFGSKAPARAWRSWILPPLRKVQKNTRRHSWTASINRIFNFRIAQKLIRISVTYEMYGKRSKAPVGYRKGSRSFKSITNAKWSFPNALPSISSFQSFDNSCTTELRQIIELYLSSEDSWTTAVGSSWSGLGSVMLSPAFQGCPVLAWRTSPNNLWSKLESCNRIEIHPTN